MKVCHVSNFLPSLHNKFGGAEQAAERIIRLESKNGIDCISVTSPFNKKKSLPNTYALPIIETHFGKLGALLKSIISFDPLSYFKLKKILKKEKPDLIHLHNFDLLSLSVIAAANKLNLPILYSIYDYWAVCPTTMLLNPKGEVCNDYRSSKCSNCVKKRKGGSIRSIFLPLTNLLIKKYLRKINRFIVLSNSSKKILVDYGISNSKTDIVYLPFLKPKFEKNNPLTDSLLYVGWIEPHKGLDVLIKALNLVQKEFPNVKLNVIGSYDSNPIYFKKINDLIKKLNVSKNVSILGRKNDNEFRQIFSQSEIIIIPEQWNNMSPLFLIESMAAGKPIVASNIGGLPEFIRDGENGFLFDPKDIHQLSEKILILLKNKEKSTQFGQEAKKEFLAKFTDDHTLANLINSYKLTLKNV
jgi:glycosyltransferase involved in cell wall biosynthesis